MHIVRLFGEHVQKQLGSTPDSLLRPQSFCVNLVYTQPEATAAALRAAESLAQDLESTIHVRALVPVPCQLEIDCGFYSAQALIGLLEKLLQRVGSNRCEYVLHVYVCRSRIETLLRVLRPSSLLVIGGRRRFWPTAEGRIAKAMRAAGHSVAFVDLNMLTVADQ